MMKIGQSRELRKPNNVIRIFKQKAYVSATSHENYERRADTIIQLIDNGINLNIFCVWCKEQRVVNVD